MMTAVPSATRAAGWLNNTNRGRPSAAAACRTASCRLVSVVRAPGSAQYKCGTGAVHGRYSKDTCAVRVQITGGTSAAHKPQGHVTGWAPRGLHIGGGRPRPNSRYNGYLERTNQEEATGTRYWSDDDASTHAVRAGTRPHGCPTVPHQLCCSSQGQQDFSMQP
jgi:hypothetical protein